MRHYLYGLSRIAAVTLGPLTATPASAGFVEFQNFNTATSSTGAGALESWENNATSVLGTPADGLNTANTEWLCSCNTVVWLPGQAIFHPGSNDETASYEFVAPTSGVYNLSATFSGRDFVFPTDTQVSIVDGYGTAPIFVGVVDGYAGSSGMAAFGASPSVSFADTLTLAQGAQLFFNVAWDPNGTRTSGPFLGDSTAIAAMLTSNGSTYDVARQFSGVQGPIWYYGVYGVSSVNGVPEPSTWAMMLLGFFGLGLMRQRKAQGA